MGMDFLACWGGGKHTYSKPHYTHGNLKGDKHLARGVQFPPPPPPQQMQPCIILYRDTKSIWFGNSLLNYSWRKCTGNNFPAACIYCMCAVLTVYSEIILDCFQWQHCMVLSDSQRFMVSLHFAYGLALLKKGSGEVSKREREG